MKEEFVTYDIAHKLKELGFDKPCMGLYYIKDKQFSKTNYSRSNKVINNDIFVDAPLWQQAIDWIRENHKIEVKVDILWINKSIGSSEIDCYIGYCNGYLDDIRFQKLDEYKTFYEARALSILKALELIKSKEK